MEHNGYAEQQIVEPTHLNGITGLLDNEERILFGSTCARMYFGEEVTRLRGAELRRKTKIAYDKYIILDLSSAVEPVEKWVNSYRNLVRSVELGWADIFRNHKEAVSPLMDHLRRNKGTLLQTSVVSVGGDARKKIDFEQHKIITHIAGPGAIRHLTQISQRLALVDVFISSVKSVRAEPSDQLFSNLSSMFRRTLDAATDVDASIRFTSDFFRPEKLQLISDWIESRQAIRLIDNPSVYRRDIGAKLQSIMGFGLSSPSISLAETLHSTQIPEKLEQRHLPNLRSSNDQMTNDDQEIACDISV